MSVVGEATGAFHVEKLKGRFWLVTPEGHGFISLGVVHVSAIAEKSKVDVFREKYGGDWGKVSEKAVADLRSWGFNTAGYHCPLPMRELIPFMADSFLVKNSNFLPDSSFEYADVFDPVFQEAARERIRKMCGGARNNPNLVGYYWTDTPQWDLRRARKTRGTDWVSAIRAMSKSGPGKLRYVEFLQERYTDTPSLLLSTYGIAGDSFDALINHDFGEVDPGDPAILADDNEFLRLIAREHYRVIGEETRRCDSRHLVFGERYLMGDLPEQVVREALPYVDVISVQPSGSEFDGDFFDRLHELTGKPIMICDHQSSFPTEEYPRTMWKQLENEEASGKAYARFLDDAFSKPYIVGYHRCQYIDRFVPYVGVLKQGLLREDETPYETLVEYTRNANLEQLRRLWPK